MMHDHEGTRAIAKSMNVLTIYHLKDKEWKSEAQSKKVIIDDKR